MDLPTCRLYANLLLAAVLAAASGVAIASDDAIDLGQVSAGARPASTGLGMPVSADTLLGATSGAHPSGWAVDQAGMPPAATRAAPMSLAPSVPGIPVRASIGTMGGAAAPGLHATVSISLTSTSNGSR